MATTTPTKSPIELLAQKQLIKLESLMNQASEDSWMN
jgi:hypothetical protein